MYYASNKYIYFYLEPWIFILVQWGVGGMQPLGPSIETVHCNKVMDIVDRKWKRMCMCTLLNLTHGHTVVCKGFAAHGCRPHVCFLLRCYTFFTCRSQPWDLPMRCTEHLRPAYGDRFFSYSPDYEHSLNLSRISKVLLLRLWSWGLNSQTSDCRFFSIGCTHEC